MFKIIILALLPLTVLADGTVSDPALGHEIRHQALRAMHAEIAEQLRCRPLGTDDIAHSLARIEDDYEDELEVVLACASTPAPGWN